MDYPMIINRMEQNRHMMDRLKEMRRDESKCSFKIKVGDATIFAHRDILMGISRYFEAMLSHDTQERQNGEVHLHDVDYECVKICVDVIYGKEVSVPQHKFEDMLFVAQMMQLDKICSAVEQLLITSITVENFLETLKTAKLFNCMKLQLACERFAAKNFKKLTDSGIFNNIDVDFIATLLQSEYVKISHREKLDFLILWLKFDIKRKSVMMSLLETIDLKQIPVGYRRYLIEEEDLIKNDLQCIRHFLSSVMDTAGVKSQKYAEYNILIFDQIKRNLLLLNPVKTEVNVTCFKRISIDGHFSVAILGCHIYMVGHDRSFHSLELVENAVWQRHPNMLQNHGHSPPVTTAAGCLYVIGGSQKCLSSTVERYSPETDQWESLNCKSRPISGAALVYFEDSILSIGGRVNNNVTKIVEKLDIVKDKWTSLSKINEKREAAAATIWKNAIVIAGGFRGSNALRSVERYHKDTDQWTLMRSMNIPRGIFQIYSIHDTLFAVGGRNDEYAKSSTEKYNTKKRIWENLVLPDTTNLNLYRTILIEHCGKFDFNLTA